MSADLYHTPPEIERHPDARLHWRCGVDWLVAYTNDDAVRWGYDDTGHAALYRLVLAWAYVAGDLA